MAHVDEKMGALSMNAGVFRFDEASADNTIALNFRYPKEQAQSKSSQFLKTCQLFQLAYLNMVTHLTMYQWKIHLFKPCWMSMKNKQVFKVMNKSSVVEPLDVYWSVV